MTNDKLRVGVIGVGAYAVLAHIPQLRTTDHAEVTAICRRDPARLAMAQEAFNIPEAYTDWREMLDQSQLDAVVVSTPHHLHAEPTIAALERGLHVLVEKPMALTSRDAWQMIEAAERARRVLMVGYPNRLRGMWRTVQRRLADGAVGQVRQITCAFCAYRRWFWQANTTPDDVQEVVRQIAQETGLPLDFFAEWGHTWHADPTQMGGGAFPDLGTHMIDLLLWLAGAPPVDVVAFTESAGLPVECFVTVQARLANGVLLSLAAADAAPQGLLSEDRHLMIVGDEGVLYNDPEGALWLHRDGERQQIEAEMSDTTKVASFINAIRSGAPDLTLAYEGAHAVEFIEATYQSAAAGRIVRIEQMSTPSNRLHPA